MPRCHEGVVKLHAGKHHDQWCIWKRLLLFDGMKRSFLRGSMQFKRYWALHKMVRHQMEMYEHTTGDFNSAPQKVVGHWTWNNCAMLHHAAARELDPVLTRTSKGRNVATSGEPQESLNTRNSLFVYHVTSSDLGILSLYLWLPPRKSSYTHRIYDTMDTTDTNDCRAKIYVAKHCYTAILHLKWQEDRIFHWSMGSFSVFAKVIRMLKTRRNCSWKAQQKLKPSNQAWSFAAYTGWKCPWYDVFKGYDWTSFDVLSCPIKFKLPRRLWQRLCWMWEKRWVSNRWIMSG